MSKPHTPTSRALEQLERLQNDPADSWPLSQLTPEVSELLFEIEAIELVNAEDEPDTIELTRYGLSDEARAELGEQPIPPDFTGRDLMRTFYRSYP